MHKRFDHTAIEKKWQARWKETGLYDAGERDSTKEKQYILVELPYPSGNLHIGHWYAFGVPDIYVRFQRMLGKQVIFPMGFDAFGLPAENAAIKNNINPRDWTQSNIEYMRGQLASMGNAFTWDKTASTIDLEYYRWTQWMFARFFEAGIAYRGVATVNWDPVDNTVIANEQVLPDGTSERSGAVVEKKQMAQWMMRITDYADELLDELDDLNWPESVKDAQRAWIGRSRGAEIDFKLSTGDKATVFTTRPDTLYGATYMVLAPEHELITKNQASIANWDQVSAYMTAAVEKKEMDRLDNTKEKTGVVLEGITAINPASGEEIPVYIADYVLASYGTGAIMAVPAHDERDHAFAQKYAIEIKRVVVANDGQIRPSVNMEPYTGEGVLTNSPGFEEMDSEEAKEKIVNQVGGRMTNTYRLHDWSVGRQRFWGVPIPIVYDPDGKAHAVPEEHLPWILPDDVDFKPTGEAPLAKSQELKKRTEDIFGSGWTPEVETMDTFVDSSWYFLRYIDPSNQDSFCSLEAQREWLPIDIYFGGAEHTTVHVLYSRFWLKALKQIGLAVHDEPYLRRINRGLILGPDGNKMSKSKGNVIDPDEQVKNVGADTVKMYLAFMGPYQGSNYPWDLGGLAGVHRFLERVNGLSQHVLDEEVEEAPTVTKLLHKTSQKVANDITELKFNTAISSLMIFLNLAEKEGLTASTYATFLRLLAPFAPHLTEELWEQAGQNSSIHSEAFPEYDAQLVVDDQVTIGVQINGKVRGDIVLAPDASEADALAAVKANASLTEKIAGKEYIKVIYKPGRILNLIVEG